MLEFNDIKKILILGAGGTAKAIAHILKTEGFDISILNRSEKRLANFKNYNAMSWDNFKNDKYDLIINTTSAGLEENTLPTPLKIMQQIFNNAKYAIDVIYNKETAFLKMAKEEGLKTKDGADMLLYQGVLAYNLFYQGRFSFDEILPFMRRSFS